MEGIGHGVEELGAQRALGRIECEKPWIIDVTWRIWNGLCRQILRNRDLDEMGVFVIFVSLDLEARPIWASPKCTRGTGVAPALEPLRIRIIHFSESLRIS